MKLLSSLLDVLPKTIIQNGAEVHIISFFPTRKFLFDSSNMFQACADVRHVQRQGYVSSGTEKPINYDRSE